MSKSVHPLGVALVLAGLASSLDLRVCQVLTTTVEAGHLADP